MYIFIYKNLIQHHIYFSNIVHRTATSDTSIYLRCYRCCCGNRDHDPDIHIFSTIRHCTRSLQGSATTSFTTLTL